MRNKNKNALIVPDDSDTAAEETEKKIDKRAARKAKREERKAERRERAAQRKAEKKAVKETAVAEVCAEEPLPEEPMAPIKEPKKKFRITDAYRQAVETKDKIVEIYDAWIKPISDNKQIIKRRLSTVVTAISLIFFILYVPILLFNKLAKGLSLGWDIALYVCIGIYVVSFAIFIYVLVRSQKCSSSIAHKKFNSAYKIITFILRLASIAVAITAICISGNGENTALDAIVLALAIVSVTFTSLSLIFGGLGGFFRWLISPPVIRRKFSFVAFEWKQAAFGEDGGRKRAEKRSLKKNRDRVDSCLDDYLLPALGKTYIDKVSDDDITYTLSEKIADENRNLCEWIIKDVFAYAMQCGYITKNPCDGLDLQGDLTKERPSKPEGKDSALSRLAGIFTKKSD